MEATKPAKARDFNRGGGGGGGLVSMEKYPGIGVSEIKMAMQNPPSLSPKLSLRQSILAGAMQWFL